MKRICLLAFSLLIFLSSFTPLRGAFAKSDLAVAKDLMAASSSQEEVSYELPYPGLLPDNPLYFLRIIRDKTVGFLIADPLKKAEFDLLQADKRLNAGLYLLNSIRQNDSSEKNDKKIKLAISTISKAENYFEQALNKMGEAKMQGRNINETEGKLKNALRKHQQELERLIQKVSANLVVSFEKEQKRAAGFEERLSH